MTNDVKHWMNGTVLALDLETTGTNVAEARIVTAALAWLDIPNDTIDSQGYLADPGIDIPAEATAVHGISTAHARTCGRPAAEVCEALHDELRVAWEQGTPVVAFNAFYDLSVLDAELRRHHGHGLGQLGPVIDPYVIDRAVDRYRRGKRKLGMVCKVYGVELTEDDAHTADGDAVAAARLMVQVAKKYPVIARMTLPELHEWQAKAHRAWAVEFEGWLRNTKHKEGATPEEVAAVVIEREWPVRTVAVEQTVAGA